MQIFNIKGNTYYFKTSYADIPFYKLNDNEIIMLDSGLYEEAKTVQDVLNEYNFTVKAVICTHAHIDHVGNNSWLREKYGAEIIMPENESMICEDDYSLHVYMLQGNFRHMEKRYSPMIFKTDRKISADETFIDVQGHRFEIVKLYGHTFYHIGIITPDDVFYVGDSLMGEVQIRDSKLSYMADITLDLQANEIIRNTKCKKYILAHKGVYDEIDYIIDKNIENTEGQVQIIYDIIKKPMTMSEICQEGFKLLNIKKNVKSYILTERILINCVNYLLYNGIIKIDIIDNCLRYVPNKYKTIN